MWNVASRKSNVASTIDIVAVFGNNVEATFDFVAKKGNNVELLLR